jgi:glycerol-3-phosphate dehydrogenase
MTFNSRNAEFGAENIEQEDSNISSSNQQADDQITNQSAKSTKIISDVMFSHAQRMKIADIVTAVLRMNRQNNSFSDISFTSSSMITIFETRFER